MKRASAGILTMIRVLLFLIPLLVCTAAYADERPVKVERVTPSSTLGSYQASWAVDGKVSDGSRWIGEADAQGKSQLTLELAAAQKIAGVHVYTGYQNEAAVQDFYFEFKDKQGQWQKIPSANVTDNTAMAMRLPFDDTVDVTTDALRLTVTKTPDDYARIREVVVWPAGRDLPELGTAVKISDSPRRSVKPHAHPQDAGIPLIYLNQSGFNLGKPKRFTAPTLPDGTTFEIVPAEGGEVLFTGTIENHLG
jgi:hypothetical protein